MIEMTLSSRHRIRNSSRARYLSVTEALHNTDFHTWMGRKHFLFLSNRRDREPSPELSVLTTTLGPPPAMADVAACRAVSNPAWCRIFRGISCFSPLNLGTLLRCCVLGQGTSPSNASLDNVYDKFNAPKRLQDCMLSVELKWFSNEQVQ